MALLGKSVRLKERVEAVLAEEDVFIFTADVDESFALIDDVIAEFAGEGLFPVVPS